MPLIDPAKIPDTAFLRFRELMADMGWRDDVAIKQLFREVVEPFGQGEKSVKMWFDRGKIPSEWIFNISTVFGVDPGWLAGQGPLSKEKAINDYGLYAREMDRVRRKRRA